MIADLLITGLLLSSPVEAEAPVRRPLHGFSYRRDEIAEGPWSIHVIKIDRSNPNLELHSLLPPGNAFGLVTLSELVKGFDASLGRPLAAINGDYYRDRRPYQGDPQGLQIMRGELISGPCDWTCFWIDSAGKPTMGLVKSEFTATLPGGAKVPFNVNESRSDNEAVLYTGAVGKSTQTSGGVEFVLDAAGAPLRPGEVLSARVVEVGRGNSKLATNRFVLSFGSKLRSKLTLPEVGSTISISTASSPSLKGVRTAIGGGPAIVRAGKAIEIHEARVRHPRAAIGWNDEFIYLIEVDGRQPNLSVGMTYDELSSYLVKIGCKEAMSMDGGGSATMWVRGQVMNSPSEGHERGMANGLVLILKK